MDFEKLSENYEKWRVMHTQMFGAIFSDAFSEDQEAQLHLTAALIHISKRDFAGALPKLHLLDDRCRYPSDRAALDYFFGLDYELLGQEREMGTYYERLRVSDVSFVFPLAFHPYYRTAKFAQKDMEFAKSVAFYRKALAFYDSKDIAENAAVGQIWYELATVYLTVHRYDACEQCLALSELYAQNEIPHRTYVKAVLYAVLGKQNESLALVGKLDPFLRTHCEPMVNAILAGTDLHYCVVGQDRTDYDAFWRKIVRNRKKISELITNGKIAEAENMLSAACSKTLAFMKRALACRLAVDGDKITVFCKNYCVKTLMCEYEALFAQKPTSLENWNFVSVRWFAAAESDSL